MTIIVSTASAFDKGAGKTRRDVLCHGDDVLSEHDEKLLLKLAKDVLSVSLYNIYSVNGILRIYV